jgi:peptidoglycan/xylan/chitin deacetylase (PgdA/CDA1 family)
MTRKRRKNKSLLISLILISLLVVIIGSLLYTKTGKEIIGNFSLAGFLQNEKTQTDSQESKHDEQSQTSDTTKSQESVPGSEPEKAQQALPEQGSNTLGANQNPGANQNADLSKVITAGIVKQASKQIALTFDAGWLYENTNSILNLLDLYNVKATFFVRGFWVKEHPDLASEIVNRGHSLENHSLTHGHMTAMTDANIKYEIRTTADIIRETTGYQPRLFRPPYGEYDKRMLRILNEEGYPYTILWTVDSYDWAEELNGVKITKDYLVNRIMSKASDNGIILMHVGGYETVHALPEIITGLRSKGYKLIKITDML